MSTVLALSCSRVISVREETPREKIETVTEGGAVLGTVEKNYAKLEATRETQFRDGSRALECSTNNSREIFEAASINLALETRCEHVPSMEASDKSK